MSSLVYLRRALRHEAAVNAQLPPKLRTFWSVGYPKGQEWPSWRQDPITQVAQDQEWVLHAFRFDIEANKYWLDHWGERPASLDAAIALATDSVSQSLVHLYSHRFMPTNPPDWGNPVLSVYQAVDSIIFGTNFADYLNHEFRLGLPQGTIRGGQTFRTGARPLAFELD